MPWLGWLVGGFLILALVSKLLVPQMEHLFLGPPTPTPTVTPTPSPPKAAIVDQTGFSFPGPEFISQARGYLEDSGYEVDLYPPKEVTVEFFSTLPKKGYRLILLETHATSEVVLEGQRGHASDVPPGPFLFTTERYEKQRYLRLQMEDQIRASKLFYEDSPLLFAVGPKFIRSSMRDFFPNTVVIIGGCQSLAFPDLARAFLDRGASVVIGWNGMVDLSHNNEAILHLLRSMTVEGLSPQEAVEEAREEIGPDPEYGSSLMSLSWSDTGGPSR
ncbi:MAG: hypothetical protein U9Q78_05650 [Chloroflexota bacterium]|nr:hypothetical protein [Chloroflexota bacterium]